MAAKTLVHVSDLNLGKGGKYRRGAIALRDTLLKARVDHVVVSGDLTHRGRASELESFRRIFAPLESTTRITLVPGDHDRLGDDVAGAIQPGPRVSVATSDGIQIVRFDSTGPHDRPGSAERGILSDHDVAAIGEAIATAPGQTLVVLLMHHHILPLLANHAPERLLSWLVGSHEEDLERGWRLLGILRGRCDLVLHGTGHTTQVATPFPDDARPLSVFSAGHSTDIGQVRVFGHERGRVLGRPAWLKIGTVPPGTEEAPPRSRWMPDFRATGA